MDLELSTVTFLPYCGLLEAIKIGAAQGFRLFEIPGDRPHAWPDDIPKNQRREMGRFLNDNGLRAEVISIDGSYLIGPGLCAEDEGTRRDVLSYVGNLIELGHDLGCSKLIMLPGRPLVTTNPRLGYQLAVQGLGECSDIAQKYNITVCIENTPFSSGLLDTPEKMVRFLRDVSAQNLAVRLDPCHSNVSKTRFRDFCTSLKPRIASVGIHDNNGDADSHLPVGQGNVDIRSAIGCLKEVGYDGSLTIEILPFEGWSLSEARKNITDSRRIVEEMMR